MNKIALKLGKVLKIIGVGLIIAISIISWMQVGKSQTRSDSSISCDGDSSDTIIIAQERFRGRGFIDIFNKMPFITNWIQQTYIDIQLVSTIGLKFLFVNGYQRNVFYVYAFSTVP
jgi:hypothetical protein